MKAGSVGGAGNGAIKAGSGVGGAGNGSKKAGSGVGGVGNRAKKGRKWGWRVWKWGKGNPKMANSPQSFGRAPKSWELTPKLWEPKCPDFTPKWGRAPKFGTLSLKRRTQNRWNLPPKRCGSRNCEDSPQISGDPQNGEDSPQNAGNSP